MREKKRLAKSMSVKQIDCPTKETAGLSVAASISFLKRVEEDDEEEDEKEDE